MTTLRWTIARVLMAAAGATVVVPLAQAQEAPRTGGLEEIIVTAQKRAESAQDVPIALSVFDSDTLRSANIMRIEEIVLRTPNFTMMRVNVGEPQFYIRGVGSNSDSAAGDPTVGVFQDEVYVGRVSGAAFDVFDMQRVEVLRGPQGTLYGRNTSGGAINFVPNRPEQDFYASASLSMGSYDTLDGRVVLNGGLTDTVAGRLSVSHRAHGGYSKNIETGAELDDEDNWSARAQVMFTPSDASRLLLGLRLRHRRHQGQRARARPGVRHRPGRRRPTTWRCWRCGGSGRRARTCASPTRSTSPSRSATSTA